MKCVIEDNSDSCCRCQRSGIPCVFVPRANAASLPDSIWTHVGASSNFKGDVLHRLQVIEGYLGLPRSVSAAAPNEAAAGKEEDCDEQTLTLTELAGLGPLWDAATVLKKSAPASLPPSIWSRTTVEHLWSWLVVISS